MERSGTTTHAEGTGPFAGRARFGPIEAGRRDGVRGFIQEPPEREPAAAPGRKRCGRADGGAPRGCRNGTRKRRLPGGFGPVEPGVPRARTAAADGGAEEWRGASLPRHARMTRRVEAPVAGVCLAGTDTRRVERAPAALFGGAAGRDVVGGTWRRVRVDREAWGKRDPAREDVARPIPDATAVRVGLDRKATNISLPVALGVRRDGRKALPAVKSMGGESEAAWRAVPDGPIARGPRAPGFLVIDGAAGLERALAAPWPEAPARRRTVHKHGNPLARAPDAPHGELTADRTDTMYADTPRAVQGRRRAFPRKWRPRCPAAATGPEEAGDRLFAFLRLPPSQWRSARTTNAIERLREGFRRGIGTQTAPPSAETAAMLFGAPTASGRITMRKVDGRQTLGERLADPIPVDLAA